MPAVTPVTTPVEASTVATAVSEDDQDPPVTVEVKVVVKPTQTFCVPDNVPATGAAVTLIVPEVVAGVQPPVVFTV